MKYDQPDYDKYDWYKAKYADDEGVYASSKDAMGYYQDVLVDLYGLVNKHVGYDKYDYDYEAYIEDYEDRYCVWACESPSPITILNRESFTDAVITQMMASAGRMMPSSTWMMSGMLRIRTRRRRSGSQTRKTMRSTRPRRGFRAGMRRLATICWSQ